MFRTTFQRFGKKVSSHGNSTGSTARIHRGNSGNSRNNMGHNGHSRRRKGKDQGEDVVAVASASLLRDWLEERNHFHGSVVLREVGLRALKQVRLPLKAAPNSSRANCSWEGA